MNNEIWLMRGGVLLVTVNNPYAEPRSGIMGTYILVEHPTHPWPDTLLSREGMLPIGNDPLDLQYGHWYFAPEQIVEVSQQWLTEYGVKVARLHPDLARRTIEKAEATLLFARPGDTRQDLEFALILLQDLGGIK